MNKLTIEEIKKLQYDPSFLSEVSESICLIEFDSDRINQRTFISHVNFVILQIIISLKKDFIDNGLANHLLNKVDALYDNTDLLPYERIMQKLNTEIVEDMLGIPYFNKMAIICDDLYVGY